MGTLTYLWLTSGLNNYNIVSLIKNAMNSKEIQTRNYSLFTVGTIGFFIFNTIIVVSMVLIMMSQS